MIVQGDARQLPLADGSVDLICTSPPYWGLRSYRDGDEHFDGQVGAEATPQGYVDELVGMIDSEWRRVLKPVGSLWLNLGDKYAGSGGVRPKSLLGLPWRVALALIDRGWILRAEVIWSKPNGLPESVRDRVRRSHETWFHFTLEPRYFSAVDEIREPYQAPHATRTDGRSMHARGDGSLRRQRNASETSNPLGRLPGSVWTIPTDPLTIPDQIRDHLGLVDHFAAFPQEWPRWIITGWCPKPGVVLDPFGGTGTTAGVARKLGRTGISIDLSADYCRLARWRIYQSGHFDKTLRRDLEQRQGTLL